MLDYARRGIAVAPMSSVSSATRSSARTSPDMPKALVIFDVDGTLVRSMAVDSQCYVSAFCDHLGIDSISTA